MKILVVTTYNNKLFDEYAHRFKKTYNWPFDLKIYNEDENLFEEIPNCKNFVERNKNKIVKTYAQDGVKFCYKVYAYTHEILKSNDYDALIGIDADSVFYKPIDEEFIKTHIHKDDYMMSYLGRTNYYSECGFLYFNLKHPYIKEYAKEMQKMYNEDLIYKEEQQHDSFIWDLIRKKFENDYQIKNNDIGDGKVGHVQARSVLGAYYDHTKGKTRKLTGKSPEARI
jgi:hypothetical protein